MTFANVVKGRVAKPVRALLYGTEGIGKSTFAAAAPSPIFLGTEDGTSELDVARLPEPHRWSDVSDAVQLLTNEQHEYQTLVVDTLDWLEPMCWQAVCENAGVKTIEDIGYGKGFSAALDEWRVFLARVERMRKAKNMNVILLAHSWIKPFKNPTGEDFDRYELKLNVKASGLMKEWCDVVLFANYEILAHKKSKNDRAKGVDTGSRLVHTQRRAAWDAKNRYDLPETMPLDWATFFEAVQAHRPADPALLAKRIEAMLVDVDEKVRAAVRASVTKANDDAAELARIADKLTGMIQTKETDQ